MKLGIISDTHNNRGNVLKAIRIFNEQKAGWVLHAGDMASAGTAGEFAALEDAKLIYVSGNCDIDRALMQRTIEELGGEYYDPSYDGEIEGKRIFMTHKPDVMLSAAGSGRYELVVSGHTHKRDIHKVGETLVVNPGKARSRLIGESSVVVVEMDDMSYEVIRL
ncbi:MAG: metallophosphoesterase [Planctomycetota bacterium]|jgi:putative phosphoesterase